MQQNALIVVFGPPASGKSTLARTLAHQLPLCRVVSPDCFEEYLREHSEAELRERIKSDVGWSEVEKYELDRSAFSEERWKVSRELVREHLREWSEKWEFVVVQDDLLLRSQRKEFRQQAEAMQLRYVEVTPLCSFEQGCLNLQARHSQNNTKTLPQETLQALYSKFELDDNPYQLRLTPQQASSPLLSSFILAHAKQVLTLHPELQPKQAAPAQNQTKDQKEVALRQLVSEIMSNSQLQSSLFGQLPISQVRAQISKAKKKFDLKTNCPSAFIQFLRGETASTPPQP